MNSKNGQTGSSYGWFSLMKAATFSVSCARVFTIKSSSWAGHDAVGVRKTWKVQGKAANSSTDTPQQPER